MGRIKYKTAIEIEQERKDQLTRQAEKQAREEALEEMIEERIDRTKLDKVKNDIAEGKIDQVPDRIHDRS